MTITDATTNTRVFTCYTPSNPFWARTARRLRDQGGPHRPSTVADDKLIMRDEIVIAMQREAHELHASALPPAPF